MTTLAEFFEREAAADLQKLRALLASPAPDAPAIHRTVRTLRGSAQMAREERVFRAALALETAVKPIAKAGSVSLSEPLLGCVRASVDDLGVLIAGSDPSPDLDTRLRNSLERWHAAGVELPAPVLGRRTTADAAGGMREFRSYAAREIDGIADSLEEGMRALRLDPMDREALKAILRRQRALRGAARLDEIPVVAEILRAVEDLTRVVAKLDVPVKEEWFDVYRMAREGLVAAAPALSDDRDPQPSSALARLRHLRSELVARYGSGETVNPSAGEREGMGQAVHLADETAPTRAGRAPAPVTAPAPVGRSPVPVAAPAPASRSPAPLATPTPAGRPVGAAAARPVALAPAPRQTAAGEPRPSAPAPPGRPVTAAGEPPAVPIAMLEYRGEAALRHALTLRQDLEDAIRDDPDAREYLEELFDLIRLALA